MTVFGRLRLPRLGGATEWLDSRAPLHRLIAVEATFRFIRWRALVSALRTAPRMLALDRVTVAGFD
jgi:hypothetical protein